MSSDTLPSTAPAQELSPTWRLPTANTTTLIAHAVDRAEGRLERAQDELDHWRAQAIPGADPEVTEIRLVAAVVAAERELAAVRSPGLLGGQP